MGKKIGRKEVLERTNRALFSVSLGLSILGFAAQDSSRQLDKLKEAWDNRIKAEN